MIDKSILDGIKIKEEGFPISYKEQSASTVNFSCKFLCAKCNAAIHREVVDGDIYKFTYTCKCNEGK